MGSGKSGWMVQSNWSRVAQPLPIERQSLEINEKWGKLILRGFAFTLCSYLGPWLCMIWETVLLLKFVASFCDIYDTYYPAIMVDRIDIIQLS